MEKLHLNSLLQMVIERANLREEEEGSGGVEEQQMYYIQLAQLVVVVALILAVWVSFISGCSCCNRSCSTMLHSSIGITSYA